MSGTGTAVSTMDDFKQKRRGMARSQEKKSQSHEGEVGDEARIKRKRGEEVSFSNYIFRDRRCLCSKSLK
jgi:hypothetical protein